uniref:Uncharacterized protein n=1 Tax=viral metagenome TaxID=1070528 RepID=A0A6C0DPY4_9ZZZZ
MRIGVTTNFQFSFFSGGSSQSSLGIAEVFRLQGHTVTMLSVGSENLWWTDLSGLKSEWNVKKVDSKETYDLVIEVGGSLLTPSQRSSMGTCVWFCRKPALLHDIEASLFPHHTPERNLEGVKEVWIQDIQTTEDDRQYLEVLTRKSVQTVPFVWTPIGIEVHRKESNSPTWPQIVNLEEVKGKPWSIHICETNTSAASSLTIPLFTIREILKKTTIPLAVEIKIHNAQHIQASEFYKKNVECHVFSDISGVKPEYIGRQRTIDAVYDPMSVFLCHSRFLTIRPYLLDAFWVGVPCLHNSLELHKSFPELEGYYPDNSIHQGRLSMEALVKAWPKRTVEHLMEVRKKMLELYTPYSQKVQKGWMDAVSRVTQSSGSMAQMVPIQRNLPEKVLRIGFCDLWDGFDPSYNVFVHMLEATGVVRVEGFAVNLKNCKDADVVLFGPFGSSWKEFPKELPKIHYTGENTLPVESDGVKLNLGYVHYNNNPGDYIRLPLWMLSINWFDADPERLGNPKPIPVERVTRVYPEEIARKTKFCAFVVSNPIQPLRNNSFHWINSYKNVDSAGLLFNTTGKSIFNTEKGGGGELMKHEFLKDYKFSITYENAAASGYTTEKLLHAKASGCIPIYWGDPKVERDFDIDGCIDARHISTKEELVNLVKEVDTNPSLWLKKYSIPALDEVKCDLVRRTLSHVACKILSIAFPSFDTKDVPKFLGRSGKEEERSVKQEEAPVKQEAVVKQEPFVRDPSIPLPSETTVTFDSTIFVTAVSNAYLGVLQPWLESILAQKAVATDLQIRVYFMSDVKKDVEVKLKEVFPTVDFRRFPTETPEDFPDFWEAKHYAWKLWILSTLCEDVAYKNIPIFYMDCGMLMCRWPRPWLQRIRETGICLLEDPRIKNGNTCHQTFQKELQMTKEDLLGQQIWAGAMCFIGGHPLATKLFTDAYVYGKKKSVIAGDKWETNVQNGFIGHRHDQSILSVLSQRYGVPRYPLDSMYCDISLRATFLKKAYLYVHRGGFKIHEPLLDGIDDAWVIHLDRRKDRLEKFESHAPHASLLQRYLRLPAFDGRTLKLTPKLARLFAPHDFKWKKSVMGCALSHLALWEQLVREKPDINSYLILEDDVRLKEGWQEAWKKTYKNLPKDWDLVYLGGILPPNRAGFEKEGIDAVNDHVGQVASNTFFGQVVPNRYFHFCAYSYVLTKQGAMKVLEVMKSRGGYWTSADHMMCNIYSVLNIYFPTPLVAGCYQDDDPVYCSSAFNDFSRKDTFDSDLWNNTECFSEEEVKQVLRMEDPLDTLGALEDARSCESSTQISTPTTLFSTGISMSAPSTKRRFVTVAGPPLVCSELYEFHWFKQIFGENAGLSLEIDRIPDEVIPDDTPIVVVQRPYVEKTRSVLEGWAAKNKTFFVLHISDEFGQDLIDFYNWPACLGVIRNYVRKDLVESSKVCVIPLGFHWAIPNGEPDIHTPRPPFREYAWSFVGTRWKSREEKLQHFLKLSLKNNWFFTDEWNSSEMRGKEETLSILLNSWWVPCPMGMHAETFRFYEALEAGAMPILVKEPGMDEYLEYLSRWFPLLVATNWAHAAEVVQKFKESPKMYEEYRTNILRSWESLKLYTKSSVKRLFQV